MKLFTDRLDNRKLFICAGEGGHFEQAKRFISLASDSDSVNIEQIVACTDAKQQKLNESIVIRGLLPVSQFSKKAGLIAKICVLAMCFAELIRFIGVFIVARPKGVVLLGPLVCIPIAVACKILRVPVVFVETWSRFSSPTKTGRVLSRLGIQCYYQNQELKSYYEAYNGQFAGRL